MNVDSCFNDRCWICSEMKFNMLQDMKTVGKQKCVDVGPLIFKFLNEKLSSPWVDCIHFKFN